MSEKNVTSPTKPQYKRSLRNLFINPRYQLRYVFWLGASGLGLIGMYSLLFYRYVRENYAILVDLSPMNEEAKAQLYRELTEVIVRISAFSVVFLVLVTVVGIIYSHRTAGPMFQFKRVFDQIKSGDTSARIHLRPNDEFKDVAQAFNQMMDTLK